MSTVRDADMHDGARRKLTSGRRAWLRMMTGLVSGAAAFRLLGRDSITALDQATGAARGAPGAGTNATPDKTTLLLLGTQGGPGVGLTRAQTASVVIAGGQPYLVDCGYGTLRGLIQAGLRFADISKLAA